jgi:hypothetical protein
VTIPSTISGLRVTGIGDGAFGNSALTTVTIPDSVTSIGDGAFGGCTGMTSVFIGSGVTNISPLPPEEGEHVQISYGEPGAFLDCSSLTNFSVAPLNPTYSSLEGVLLNKTQDRLIVYPQGKSGSGNIPDSVTSIGDWAFVDCTGLTNVVIPNSVTNLGGAAFSGCLGLTDVTIPGSVISIGDGAFSDCLGLTDVTIPGSVVSIGDWAFARCRGLTSLTLLNGLASIGSRAFWYCDALSAVTIPNSVTNIGDFAFSLCSALCSVTIGRGVTNLTGFSFSFSDYSVLTNITVDSLNPAYSSLEGVLFTKGMIALIVFPAAKLSAYTVPNGVTSIGKDAFYECSGLTGLILPSSLSNIGAGAFYGCGGLASVTVPDSVTNIGPSAFSACAGLTNITVNSLNPAYDSAEGALFNKGLNALLAFPAGKHGSYAVPDSVTTIGDGAFSGCSGLTGLVLPNSLSNIGAGAFSGCDGLASLIIPDNVTNLGAGAFSACAGLTNIVLGNRVPSIGSMAFSWCAALRSLTIPASVTNIDSDAFLFCSGLSSLYFAGNAPLVGIGLFLYATNATVFYLPGATGFGWSWSWSFKGRAAVLWNPEIMIGYEDAGSQAGALDLTIVGTPNIPFVLETAANVTTGPWTSLQTGTLTNGLALFSDSEWTNYPARFYRIRSP